MDDRSVRNEAVALPLGERAHRRWLALALLGVGLALASPARAFVVWGDVHAHSSFSQDARTDPTVFYTTARDVVKLDFVVLSDHDIWLSDSEWAALKNLAASFNDPGRFVAFLAVEWTQGYHMNVYFRGDDGLFCGGETGVPCPTSADFASFYSAKLLSGEAMAQVNHPKWTVPWHEVSATLTPNAEMFNNWWDRMWGGHTNEHDFGHLLWALRVGHRLGFVGASDYHGYAYFGSIGSGLTGCHVNALTREEIFNALRLRRCYATDGQRIDVDFNVNGTTMGGELTAPIGTTVTATVDVLGTAVPSAIEIVRNGRLVASESGCTSTACRFSAPVVIEDEHTFIYARVRQHGGFRAWASPVWVNGSCTTATCPVERFVAGEPISETECSFRWRVREASERSGQLITCVDGDPACDSGSTVGECTFRVGVCTGVTAGAPVCRPHPVPSTTLLQPNAREAAASAVDNENRLTLMAALKALGPTSPPGRCTPYVDVRVPLERRNNGTLVRGQRTLSGEAPAAAGTDRDLVRLRCLPAK